MAIELFGGVAAETLKLGDYDVMAHGSDVRAWRDLGCSSSSDHYIQQAIGILKERDAGLVRVYDRLMQERAHPSYSRFQDTEDHIWKLRHLTQEDFEALM